MPQPKVPNEKPRISTSELEILLRLFNWESVKYPFIVVGIRGYYLNSMGAPGVNDRGI